MKYEMEIILNKSEPFNCLPRRLSIHERGRLKDILNKVFTRYIRSIFEYLLETEDILKYLDEILNATIR